MLRHHLSYRLAIITPAHITTDLLPRDVYLANSRQRHLFVEAAAVDQPDAISAARPNHRVEAVLDPGEHLGLALQDGYDVGIGPLDQADHAGQQLGPVGEATSVVRRP